jgi:group I intron endonuclease
MPEEKKISSDKNIPNEENIKVMGIIYMITNIVNNKLYIGQTKSHYGKAPFGATGRFKAHITSATGKSKNGCRMLNNAINKYGADKFNCKVVMECSLEDRDKNETETELIKKYDSTNPEKGYNITLGGKGRSVVHVDEDIREKISKSQNTTGLMNIKEYHEEGILIGYRIRRREQGITHQKYFVSKKNTPEDNLKLANTYIENLKKGIVDNNKYNKIHDLPKNISFYRDKIKKGDMRGYSVHIMKDGKKYLKTFSSLDKTMEQKLEMAIEYKNSVLNNKDL